MIKQIFGKTKKTLAILLIVLFILSVTATAINAKTDMKTSGIKDVTKTTIAGKNDTATKTTITGKNATATKTTIAGENATATKVTVTKKI